MNPKVFTQFKQLKQTIFEGYLNIQHRKSLLNTFHALLDEQNIDSIDDLSFMKVAQNINIDIFEFFSMQKFDFIKISTEIAWKPGKYRERFRKDWIPYQPSQKHYLNARDIFAKAHRILMLFQRFVSYFVCQPYKSSSIKHDCLMLYLRKWTAANKIKDNSCFGYNKREMLQMTASNYYDKIWFLLNSKTAVYRGDQLYLETQVSQFKEDNIEQETTQFSQETIKRIQKICRINNLPQFPRPKPCKASKAFLIARRDCEEWIYDCECNLHKFNI